MFFCHLFLSVYPLDLSDQKFFLPLLLLPGYESSSPVLSVAVGANTLHVVPLALDEEGLQGGGNALFLVTSAFGIVHEQQAGGLAAHHTAFPAGQDEEGQHPSAACLAVGKPLVVEGDGIHQHVQRDGIHHHPLAAGLGGGPDREHTRGRWGVDASGYGRGHVYEHGYVHEALA